jgi:hypothetical protein
LERRAQDDVYLEDRLGVEAAFAVDATADQELAVERVDMFAPDETKRDSANPGRT